MASTWTRRSWASPTTSAATSRSPCSSTSPTPTRGGELAFDHGSGEIAHKLPARSAICYPTGQLHRVRPVEQGERLAVVGWVQSLCATRRSAKCCMTCPRPASCWPTGRRGTRRRAAHQVLQQPAAAERGAVAVTRKRGFMARAAGTKRQRLCQPRPQPSPPSVVRKRGSSQRWKSASARNCMAGLPSRRAAATAASMRSVSPSTA